MTTLQRSTLKSWQRLGRNKTTQYQLDYKNTDHTNRFANTEHTDYMVEQGSEGSSHKEEGEKNFNR